MKQKTLYDWAIAYRKFGWNVIPLYDCSKIPSRVNWKEFQDRFATPAEIDNWFLDPDEIPTGIGVITGRISELVAVDEDSYKADGMKFEFTSPMFTRTARGGTHHFFRYVQPVKTSGFRQGVNIEIKADGGFLVLPPSIVEVNKITHETGTYEWVEKCAMEKLPAITEAQLLPYRGSLTKSGAVELRDFLHAQTGTRHNNLRTVALVIFNRFNESEWELAEDAVRVEAMKQDPPMSESEVDRIISDVQNFIRINPKDAKKEAAKASNKKDWSPASTNDLVLERIQDRELEKIAPKTGWPELDELIKGFVPKHTITLTGDTNVGKTTIAANFTEALREQGKKVLYIALEPDVNLIEYLASVRRKKAFKDVTDDELQVGLESDELVKIFLGKDIAVVDDLVDAIENIPEHFDLVIIDHIGYFVNSENNWIQQQSNIIKQLAGIAKQKKLCIMMIAHLRKPGGSKKKDNQKEVATGGKYDWIPTQNDIAGSAAFKQDSTEVLIAIRKYMAEDEFNIQFSDEGALLVTKTKAGRNGAVPLIFTPGSALVQSLAQIRMQPERFQEYEEKRRVEQQMRIGDGMNDPWDEEDDSN